MVGGVYPEDLPRRASSPAQDAHPTNQDDGSVEAEGIEKAVAARLRVRRDSTQDLLAF
jgi:hypothetical protein